MATSFCMPAHALHHMEHFSKIWRFRVTNGDDVVSAVASLGDEKGHSMTAPAQAGGSGGRDNSRKGGRRGATSTTPNKISSSPMSKSTTLTITASPTATTTAATDCTTVKSPIATPNEVNSSSAQMSSPQTAIAPIDGNQETSVGTLSATTATTTIQNASDSKTQRKSLPCMWGAQVVLNCHRTTIEDAP